MPGLPCQIRLAAGDYFMYGQDHRMRQTAGTGNLCRIAVKLEGNLNPETIPQRIAASPVLGWLTRLRTVRPWKVLPYAWRTTANPTPFFHQCNSEPTPCDGPDFLAGPVLEHDLHPGLGPALVLDLVRHPDETLTLVLSWNHALLDARGAELILRHLSAENPAQDESTLENLINPGQQHSSLSRWWRNLTLARGSLPWLRESGREPLFSLLPATPSAGPRRNLCRLLLFSDQEAARIAARCDALHGGLRRSSFYLAASIRAVHAVATRRGNATAAYLVPVPHDMRRRGANGPIFSNHLSILFYRIEPRQAERLSDIVAELTRQMMDQIRDRFPESCMAALDTFRPMRLNHYLRHLGQPTRGKFATLCFSDSGETCAGIKDMLGGRIQGVTHWVHTWRPPGLTVLFWSFRGRPCALLSWVDDCLSPAEVETLEHSLRAALLEEEVA